MESRTKEINNQQFMVLKSILSAHFEYTGKSSDFPFNNLFAKSTNKRNIRSFLSVDPFDRTGMLFSQKGGKTEVYSFNAEKYLKDEYDLA